MFVMEKEKELIEEEKQEFHKFVLEGDAYKTLLTKKYLVRKPYVENDPGKVVSFIPGTIIKIFVDEKQKVKTGEKLLILEAMKMQNILVSPINGIVKKIYISEGDKVANKQMLIEIKNK